MMDRKVKGRGPEEDVGDRRNCLCSIVNIVYRAVRNPLQVKQGLMRQLERMAHEKLLE